jgi:AcrR family transcriptional regulator
MMAEMSSTNSPRPSLAERHRAERAEQIRQEIVDAAVAEFAERGYHETSLANIAGRLRAGASTIYNYFRGKQEILEHAIEHTIASLSEELIAGLTDPPRTLAEFREGANRYGDMVADYLVEHPTMVKMLTVVASTSNPVLRARWTSACDMATALIEQYLAEGVALGHLRSDLDTASTAAAILAIPIGMAAADPTLGQDRKRAHTRVRATVAMVASGIFPTDDPT